jgi:hypothetical protein
MNGTDGAWQGLGMGGGGGEPGDRLRARGPRIGDPRRGGARGDGLGAVPGEPLNRGGSPPWHWQDFAGEIWEPPQGDWRHPASSDAMATGWERINAIESDGSDSGGCPEVCLRLYQDALTCLANVRKTPREHADEMRRLCLFYRDAYEQCLSSHAAYEVLECPVIPSIPSGLRKLCCVIIKCAPIPGFLGMHHCFFEIKDCTSDSPHRYELWQWDWAGDAPTQDRKPFSGQERIVEDHVQVGAGVGGPRSATISVVEECYFCEGDDGAFVDTPCACLRREMAAYEFGSEYHLPDLPNSNTFAMYMSARCGLKDPLAPFPVWAPGAIEQPPPIRFRGDDNPAHTDARRSLHRAYVDARRGYGQLRAPNTPGW